MFSDAMVGLIAAIGVGAFVYSKTNRSSGNNVKSALMVAGITAVIVFIAVLIILKMIFS